MCQIMESLKKSIDAEAVEKLMQHNWTGNIRELEERCREIDHIVW